MAVIFRPPAIASNYRRFLIGCLSCIPLIAIVATCIFLFPTTGGHVSAPSYEDSLDRVAPAGTTDVKDIDQAVGDWRFDVARDGKNFGLSDEQCDAAFPGYFHESERAVAWRQKENMTDIDESQLDTSWRSELIRIMIFDRQLYLINTKWSKHGYDLPRGLALLQQIHRSIIAFPGHIPNIEATLSLGDWPADPKGKWPTWVLTRHKDEQNKWVIPDFGYWSWPLAVVGDYTEFRNNIKENEVTWQKKIRKAVWRGAAGTNKLREKLIEAAHNREWSDVHAIKWINITTMDEESSKRSLTMADHCNYQFLVHTEGHTYSGRGKYLLNCESVSIVHDADWIEPHTHLLVNSGPEQNIIRVKRDFSDLNENMQKFIKEQDQARKIAQRSAAVFRDRYLTPAAQACYWRKLFKAYASVSFEPQLYRTVKDEHGKIRRKSRGVPFETFMASLALPAAG